MLLYGCITGPEIVGLKINPNTPAGISLLHIVFIQICCFFLLHTRLSWSPFSLFTSCCVRSYSCFLIRPKLVSESAPVILMREQLIIRTKVVSGICLLHSSRNQDYCSRSVSPSCFRRLDEISFSVVPAAHCSVGEPFNPAHHHLIGSFPNLGRVPFHVIGLGSTAQTCCDVLQRF